MKGRRAKEQTGGGSFRSELVKSSQQSEWGSNAMNRMIITPSGAATTHCTRRDVLTDTHTHTTGTETFVKGSVPKSKEVQSALFSV